MPVGVMPLGSKPERRGVGTRHRSRIVLLLTSDL